MVSIRRAQRALKGGQQEFAAEAYLDTSNAVLDLTHLRSMTAGDRALEVEILGLFAAQAQAFAVALAADAKGAATPMALHTIKGAARGVGAGQVAGLAAAVERTVRPQERVTAVAELAAALAKVQAAIIAHLQLL
ncbi:MAG TPA: Hpt domain-containing protein [Pseudolabrys sp.]|nr:Hpt domain-containing protein [Pseudolabrys sp.]